MTYIWVLADGVNVGLYQGWYATDVACLAELHRLTENAQRGAMEQAKAAVTNELVNRERLTAGLQVLAAAGITDPTVENPAQWTAPDITDYLTMPAIPLRVTRVSPVRPQLGEPSGDLWMFSNSQKSVRYTDQGWCSDQQTAERHADECNKVGPRDYYEVYLAADTRAREHKAREIRDWKVLADVGLAPTRTQPQMLADPNTYDQWRARKLAGPFALHPAVIHPAQ